MPPPMSRYHDPPPARAGSIPAARQSRFSRASVPLLSPRETNSARAAAIAVSAAAASWPSAICAGSARGSDARES